MVVTAVKCGYCHAEGGVLNNYAVTTAGFNKDGLLTLKCDYCGHIEVPYFEVLG